MIDVNEYGKFNTETDWNTTNKDDIARIESTIVELNKEYPMVSTADLEHIQNYEKFVACDYDKVKYYLPDGENDRRLSDDAMAQVFLTHEGGKDVAIIGYRREFFTETFEESLANRQKAIDNGEVLLSVCGASPESVTIHEYGHITAEHLTNAMIYEDDTATGYYEWYKSLSKEEIREGLSAYATTNRGEFEAECFAEMLMPEPRPIALKYKEYIDEAIKKGY